MIFNIIQSILVLGRVDLGIGEDFCHVQIDQGDECQSAFLRGAIQPRCTLIVHYLQEDLTFSGLVRFSVNRYMPVLLSPSLRYMSSSFNEWNVQHGELDQHLKKESNGPVKVF